MIESQAHYETYYHILNSLQKAEISTMPFTEILIESKCQEVQPPAYMCLTTPSNIDHPQLVFNMKDALGINEICSEFHSFDVSRPEHWPNVELVQLDESQLKAMKMALTQKVSVIQGPPGTGKTYIGMKIVQALLTNHHVWDSARNSPLLVVCYTNHALDQFLEGIINMNNCVSTNSGDESEKFSIVRVGGRCQNEKVSKYSIKNIELRKPRVPRDVYFETRDIKEMVKETGTDLDQKFQIVQQKLRPHHTTLVEFIAPFHKEQLHSHHQINVQEQPRMRYRQFKHQEMSLSDYSVAQGLKAWLSCEDLQRLVVNKKADAKNSDETSESSESESDQNEVKFTYRTNEVFMNNPSMLKGKDVVNETLKGELLATKDGNNPKTSDTDVSSDMSEMSNSKTGDNFSDGGNLSDGDNLSDGAEDTVHVIGEAELAGNQRMVDHPADVFHYEGTGIGDDMAR